METRILDLSISSIVRTIALVVLALLLFVLRDILLLLFTAFILGSGLYLVASFLNRRLGIPYKAGVIGALAVLVLALAGLMYLFVPKLAGQIADLRDQVPTIVNQSEEYWAEAYWNSVSDEGSTQDSLISGDNLSSYARNVASGVFFATGNILAGLAYAVILVVISVYLAFEPNNLEHTIAGFWPEEKRPDVLEKVSAAREKVGNWIVGQVVLALILGSLSYLVLYLLGVENALLLGVVSGFFNMIPFIGPILATIPAVIFGFLESVQTGVAVLVAYLILQQLEGNFLTPAIMNKVTGLSHVLIIISILIGGALAGALGAVIAIPLVSVLSLFIKGLQPSEASEST